MAGKWMTIKASDGGKFRAYVASSAGGKGPGLLLMQEIFGVNAHMREVADLFAEEGYVVVVPDLFWRLAPRIELGFGDSDMKAALGYFARFDVDKAVRDAAATLKAVRAMPKVSGGVGVIGYCLGGLLSYLVAARCKVDCAVSYYGVGIDRRLDEVKKIRCPILFNFGEADTWTPPKAIGKIRKAFAKRTDAEIYLYPGVGHAFANPHRPSYDRPSAWMAHSRAIALLRRTLGPRYDLSALWDMHTFYEFGARDVAATMKTMVAEPYVNHIPVLTGGVGHDNLARFYKYHFIPKCPADTKLVPVSRTIGADRVVDEMLFCFTHDTEIDWMLPGIAPTGKYVEVPLVAIVNFRGAKLYHEHIYWDQASVLVQIGLLDPGRLPVVGREQAEKLLDEKLPSNRLMGRWRDSEGKPAP